ncbi:hypothetical protein FACS189431_1590 [Alphaproteobacteria bacterium]|nr:hypothetical protein FACS189431_1590 [Alphaproteobacteria bacterium]
MNEKIVEFIKQFNPLSAFLYGSRATGEATEHSDWEVGLIFNDDQYVSRKDIKAKQDFTGVSIYPFRLSEIKNYTLDTPFPKKLFVYGLIKSAKTIFVDDIISGIELPVIEKTDLVGAIRFEIGVAFCSFLTLRRKDNKLAFDEFSKSCLHGLKIFIMVKRQEFLSNYAEIYEASKKLDLPEEYLETIEAAYAFKKDGSLVDENYIYKNMSFLNYVEAEVLGEE